MKDRITENIEFGYELQDELMRQKAPSEWLYVSYRCMQCKHEGVCPTRIGEFPFCGRCGSEDLVKRKPKEIEDAKDK